MPRLFRRLRSESGFGLIELTIAMTMLAIGIAGLGGLFVSGHFALRRASQSDTAAVLASKLLERFRAETWDTVGISKTLFDSADSTYTGDPAYSTEPPTGTAIADSSGLCSGARPGFTSCWPSRAIPDASQSPVEMAPDGRSYRLDTYVNWGCADGSAPDTSTSPPTCSQPYSQVKIVTIVVRDNTSAATLAGTPVYRTSTTFDRLAGGSMPTVTASPSSGSSSTTTTPTATSPPAPPSSVSLANGGGTAGGYIDIGNLNSLSFDVALPDTSVPTDKIDLTVSDGNPDHDQTARLFGTSGSGILHFTGINGQALTDGPITVTITSENAFGKSDPTTATVTKDTGAPAPPTSIALANGQGSSNAVNASTASAVSVSVGLDATSQNTDTVNVTLTKGGSSTNPYTAPATTGLGTVTVTGIGATLLTDGTVTASATSVDQAGNSSAALTTTFPKDTSTPSVSIMRVGSSATNASTVQWTLTLSEPVTISATNFNLVNTGLTSPSITSVTGSGTSYTTAAGTGTGDGNLGLNLKANSVQDDAGNVAAAVTGQVFTVDRTAPTVGITSPTSGQNGFNTGGPFTGTNADAGSGIATVTVKFCKDTTWTCGSTPTQTGIATISGGTWSLTLSGGSKLSNGKSYVMRVTAVDAAGNSTTTSDRPFHT
jgi:Tfp pilus assembly protein PilV